MRFFDRFRKKQQVPNVSETPRVLVDDDEDSDAAGEPLAEFTEELSAVPDGETSFVGSQSDEVDSELQDEQEVPRPKQLESLRVSNTEADQTKGSLCVELKEGQFAKGASVTERKPDSRRSRREQRLSHGNTRTIRKAREKLERRKRRKGDRD